MRDGGDAIDEHHASFVIRTSRLFALTLALLLLSLASLTVQVLTSRDVSDIRTRVVALCVNGSSINLCDEVAARWHSVTGTTKLCKVITDDESGIEVRCLPEAPRK